MSDDPATVDPAAVDPASVDHAAVDPASVDPATVDRETVDHATGDHASVGIIGGSGMYEFFADAKEIDLDTPWGKPSGPLTIGQVGARRVAFVARHGTDHQVPPHRVNARANVWAMHELGVRQLLGPCASGSLRADVAPGEFVVCDQLVDRTAGRDQTYFEGPTTFHASFAEPYCDYLRCAAVEAGRELGITVHDRGTVVVIEGPRFSTRAESRWHAAMGWDLVNMTQYPEAVLARELGICYAAVALVTDWDAGVAGGDGVRPVEEAEVFAHLARNAHRVRDLLRRMISGLPDLPLGCACPPAPELRPQPPPPAL